MTFSPCSKCTGLGSPSSPTRPQSHNFIVKIYGVELISSTIEFFPEQCIVPAGIEIWSCFFTLNLFIYLSASKTFPCCPSFKADIKSFLSTSSFMPK